jgi:AcrR family transcriptional regulator
MEEEFLPRTKGQYEAMRIRKKGFAATNVQDIAEGAGISIGLMYRHYKTSTHLYNITLHL